MTTEKLEKQIAQHQARLAEIPKEMRELERAPERLQDQLARNRAEISDLTARIRSGETGECDADLAAALREDPRIDSALAEAERTTGSKLNKLRVEEQKLQDDLARMNREIAKTKLSEAVMAYQQALRAALPYSDAIKKYANEAGVIVSNSGDGFDPFPLERGTHVCGGIVIELR